jgi:hypothetical protein
METHLSSISSNTSLLCPPSATGAAAAATLIAVSEAFLAGALFTTGGFIAGFFGRCLGIGGVLATGRTSGVDGALAAGSTAAACPCPTICVPILFHFEPAAALAMVPPSTAAAPPSTLDAAAAGGVESAVAACWVTTGGCGRPWELPRWPNRPAPVGERRSSSGGGAESGGTRAEISLQPTPRTSWGSGSVCPFNPHKCGSGPRRWWRRQIYLRASDGWGSVPHVPLPQPANRRLFCGLGLDGGSARVALSPNKKMPSLAQTLPKLCITKPKLVLAQRLGSSFMPEPGQGFSRQVVHVGLPMPSFNNGSFHPWIFKNKIGKMLIEMTCPF